MKHPATYVLQDYFENALNPVQEGLVKDHLLNCDECTKILTEMSIIERKMKEVKTSAVPEALRLRIFKDAGEILQQKRAAKIDRANLKESRIQKQQEIVDSIRGMWELFQNELRTPALQFCSVSLVLVTIIAAEKLTPNEVSRYEPISTQVHTYNFDDSIQEEEER